MPLFFGSTFIKYAGKGHWLNNKSVHLIINRFGQVIKLRIPQSAVYHLLAICQPKDSTESLPRTFCRVFWLAYRKQAGKVKHNPAFYDKKIKSCRLPSQHFHVFIAGVEQDYGLHSLNSSLKICLSY